MKYQIDQDQLSDVLERFCKDNNLEFKSADELLVELTNPVQVGWLSCFVTIWEECDFNHACEERDAWNR